jgi:hypothetical protein
MKFCLSAFWQDKQERTDMFEVFFAVLRDISTLQRHLPVA